MRKIKIEIVSGVEGPSVYINDHRIAGNKPWGGGTVLVSTEVTAEEFEECFRGMYELVEKKSDNKEGKTSLFTHYLTH